MGLVNAQPCVAAVHRDAEHRFSKRSADHIHVIAGIGVEGDAHAGGRIQHLSRMRADPSQPNLRQVHLIQVELFEELADKGFAVQPGDLGENITTRGIDLLGLSRDAILRIGADVVLKVTGLRNPCAQIEAFSPGLLKHLAVKVDNQIIRKAGVMSVAIRGGNACVGDRIRAEQISSEHIPLERV